MTGGSAEDGDNQDQGWDDSESSAGSRNIDNVLFSQESLLEQCSNKYRWNSVSTETPWNTFLV